MGFNTTVVVMNDSLHAIAEDPEFGKNLVAAILRLQVKKGPQDVCAGSKNCVDVNAATAIESHHADMIVPVLVGGNCGVALDACLGWRTLREDDLGVNLLKALASKHGYRLVKKNKEQP